MSALLTALQQCFPPRVWPAGITARWGIRQDQGHGEGVLLILTDENYVRELRLELSALFIQAKGPEGIQNRIDQLVAEALEPPPLYVP